jgi:hypothetical protein
MPTYRVTGPDGQVYRVTPPEGTNPTSDEVLAQVKAHVGGTGGEAPPAPDSRSWFQKYVSAPATAGAARGLAQVGETLLAPADLAASALKASGVIPQSVPFGFDVRGGGLPAAEKAAEWPAKLIVPQSGIEAGILAGTALAGPALAALGKTVPAVARAVPAGGQAGATLAQKLVPPASRIAGATAGGALGGGVTGEGAGRGALIGAASGATGETLVYLGGKFLRSIPGAQGRIAAKDAERLGEAIEDLSHPLKGARTVEDVYRLASGEGLKKLGDAKAAVVRDIERSVPTITVPSLGGRAVTLTEANRELSEIGVRAFSQNPLDRTINGIDQRRLYRQLSQEIESVLTASNPDAGALWRGAQGTYSKGRALLDEVLTEGIYGGKRAGMTLKTPALQDLFRKPERVAELQAKLTPAEFQRLVDAVTRGAPIGARDVLRPMSLNPLSLRNLLLGGGGYGLFGPAGGFAAALPYVAPNVASTYAGRAPFAASQSGRLAADVLAAKGAGVTQWPQQPTIEDRSRDLDRQAEQFRRWRQQYLLP